MPGGTRVYVGDLGDRGSRTELEREFSKYGRLREVWVARNPPGFAFVFFDDPRDAEDAVQGMDGRYCCGVRIRVEMARGDTRDRPKYGPKCYECGRIGHSGRECTRRPGYQYRGKNASIRDRRSSYRSRSRSKDRKSGRRSRSRSRSGERKRSKRRSASPERSRSTSPVRRSRSRSADRRSSSPTKDARRRSRSVGRRSLSRSRSRSVSQERKRKSQSTEVKRSRSLSRSPSKERDENANESGGKDDKGSASDEGSNVIKPEDY